MIRLSLRWLISQSYVDSVILGASKPEHLEENIQAADGKLDADTVKACDAVWKTIRGDHFGYNR